MVLLASSQKRKSGMAFGSLLFGKGIYRCEFREGNEGMCQMNISNPFLFLPYLFFSRSNMVHRKRRGIEKAGFSIIQTHYIRAKKSILLLLREFPTCPTRQKKRDVLLFYSGKLEQQGNKNGIARKGKVVRFLGG